MDQGWTATALHLHSAADLIRAPLNHMRRTSLILPVLGSLLIGIVLSSCAPKAEDIAEEVVEKTLSAGDTPRISIRNLDGAIRVYGSRDAEVKVRALKRAYGSEQVRKIVVNASAGANTVDIDTIYPPRPKLSLSDRSGTVDYTIIVPQGSTISRLELTNGEVLIDNLRGGAVSAKLVNGRLFDRDGFGAHDLFVANGALEMGWEWWEAGKFSIQARVVSGTIRAVLPPRASFHLKARAGGKISNAFGDVPNVEKDRSQTLDVAVGGRSEAQLELQTTQGNIGILEHTP